jgi:hypothetical protein
MKTLYVELNGNNRTKQKWYINLKKYMFLSFSIIISYIVFKFIVDQFFQLGYVSLVWFYIVFFSLIINLIFLYFSLLLSKSIFKYILSYNLKEKYSKFFNIFFCCIILYILPSPVLNCYNAIRINISYNQGFSQKPLIDFEPEYKQLNENNIFINMFKRGTLENNIIFSRRPDFKKNIKQKDYTQYFLNESLENRYGCVGDCDNDNYISFSENG